MRVIVLVLISILCSQTVVGKDAFRLTSTSLGDSLIPQKKQGFSISTDLYGTFNSTIYKDYNPDGRAWLGSMSLFAQYNFGQWAIGGGGALEIEQFQLLAFDLLVNRIRQSVALGSEYRYGKNQLINYQCLGRIYYHFDESKVKSNNENYTENSRATSMVLGWGPKVNIYKTQISPVLNLNWLFKNEFKHVYFRTGVFVNLNFPIN